MHTFLCGALSLSLGTDKVTDYTRECMLANSHANSIAVADPRRKLDSRANEIATTRRPRMRRNAIRDVMMTDRELVDRRLTRSQQVSILSATLL